MRVVTRLEVPDPWASVELTDGEISYLELSADLLRETQHDGEAFASLVLPILRRALRLHADELMQALAGEPDDADEAMVRTFLAGSLSRPGGDDLEAPPSAGETVTVDGDLLGLELLDGLPVGLRIDDYTVRPEARYEVEQALRAALDEALTRDAEALQGAVHDPIPEPGPRDWADLADRIYTHQRTQYR